MLTTDRRTTLEFQEGDFNIVLVGKYVPVWSNKNSQVFEIFLKQYSILVITMKTQLTMKTICNKTFPLNCITQSLLHCANVFSSIRIVH